MAAAANGRLAQPCRFYQAGYCSRGSSCFYTHDQPAAETASSSRTNSTAKAKNKGNSGLRANASEFVLRGSFTTSNGANGTGWRNGHTIKDSNGDSSKIPCRYFAKDGWCRNGDICAFSHDVSAQSVAAPTSTIGKQGSNVWRRTTGTNTHIPTFYGSPLSSTTTSPPSKVWRRQSEDVPPSITLESQTLETAMSSLYLDEKKQQDNVRTIGGATVTFIDGAGISSFELPSDYISAQITGLPETCTPEFLSPLLKSCGVTVEPSHMKIHIVEAEGDTSATAEVTYLDPGHDVVKTINELLGSDTTIHASAQQSTMALSSTSANKLQMSSVSCKWYKPSRIIKLKYGDFETTKHAKRVLERREINGRRPSCDAERGFGTNYSTLILKNLDPSTSENDIRRALGRGLYPRLFHSGTPNFNITSIEEQGEIVRRLLERQAPVKFWEVFDASSSSETVKAVARFDFPDDAKLVASNVHNSKVPEFANSKLFANVTASVKFRVLTQIYEAVQNQINEVKREVDRPPMHVHIKYYPVTDPYQRTTYLRVSGGDVKSVAKVKGRIEKILRGTLAEAEDGNALWHPFFSKPEALVYFRELQIAHSTFIYSDLKKSRLTIYGSSQIRVERSLVALREKLETLLKAGTSIAVSAKQIDWLLKGGLRRLQGLLGVQSAILDITKRPPALKLNGLQSKVDEALELLRTMQPFSTSQDPASNDDSEDEDCSVCWTEAVNGFCTDCDHTFCKECFVNLCSSAGESGQFPIKCLAAKGTQLCNRTIPLKELSSALSSKEYEKLLETSVGSYVRKSPQCFQYCPTPDCEQIYRVSGSAKTFICPSCLTSICTYCQISHEGITCAESKDFRSGGAEAFEKWKKANNVKDCPKCVKTSLEKIDGCNHVECPGCKTHICWVCLAHFKTSPECYEHMRVRHGGCFDYQIREHRNL